MPERALYTISYQEPGGTTYTEITSSVTNIKFTYGMQDGFQTFANPARATITINNSTGAFNPDSGTATYDDLTRGSIFKIEIDTGSGDTALFIGKVADRQFDKDFMTLTVEDQMLRLLASDIKVPLEANVRIDEAIVTVFDQQVALWPYDSAYFTIGYSKLGAATVPVQRARGNVLFGTGSEGDTTGTYANLTLQEARTTLTYAGDLANEEINAQTYLRELVDAEGGGRFFWDAPTAKFKFQNRWNDSVNYSVSAYLTGDDIVSAVWSMDSDLINHAEVNYRPRAVSNSVTVLYDTPNAITLKTSTTLDITANYQDPANPSASCAAIDPVCIIGTDIIINTQQDGSGTNVTAQQIVTVEFNATSATLSITNTTSGTLYITKLQVRGKPVSLLNVETAEYTDIESIRLYDRLERVLNIPALDDADTAQSIAKLNVIPRSTPIRRFRRVTFIANKNATLMGHARNRRIGDGVNIQYDSHNRDYVIVGQEHRIIPGGSNGHEVMWYLKDSEASAFFTIGTSKLGGPQVLAF